MTESQFFLLLVAVLLVMLGGLFAAMEAAVSQLSLARIEQMEREGVRGAARLREVVADTPRHVTLLLLLRLGCELLSTTLVTGLAVDLIGLNWRAVLLSALVMTVVSFVLVGVGPRTLGRQHAYPLVRGTARLLLLLAGLLGPLVRLLILLGNAITPGKGFREGPFATQLELRELVDLAEERGVVEHGERDMIHSVFELGDTIAREVMVPRTDVVWIERQKTVRQALALSLRSGYSRIPVIGENVDDCVGIVYLKDLVRRAQGPEAHDGDKVTRVEDVMRPATLVPESKPVDDLLREMQAQRVHMAIVIDEYGGTAGLVTIEDILEEIVGEITDEYDVERPPVEHLPDGTVRVTARLSVEDLNDLFDAALPTDDVETVGGVLAQALGRVPIPGAEAEVGGLVLTAESAGGRRNQIERVLVRRADDK